MRMLGGSGMWEIFVPELLPGTCYKYEIRARDGDLLLKADPFATVTETPPGTASVVYQTTQPFADGAWMKATRRARSVALPDLDL